jgi:hypothetical protein
VEVRIFRIQANGLPVFRRGSVRLALLIQETGTIFMRQRRPTRNNNRESMRSIDFLVLDVCQPYGCPDSMSALLTRQICGDPNCGHEFAASHVRHYSHSAVARGHHNDIPCITGSALRGLSIASATMPERFIRMTPMAAFSLTSVGRLWAP